MNRDRDASVTRASRRAALAAAGGLAATALLPRAARAAQVLRWATVLPGSHPEVTMMERVAADVKAATGGAVEVQVFPAGQLGSSRDTVEAVSSGVLQMVSEGAAQFGQFLPVLSILEAPYIWRDLAHMRRVLASPILEDMSARLAAAREMRIVGGTYYGTRHVTSGSRPVAKLADMAGFKLRIPEVDTYRAMAEAWGAKPTPLNIGELYLALSQGAVDGQENPLPTIQSTKLYEVQKHLALTGHIMTPRLVAVNQGAWTALDGRAQEAVRAAVSRHGEALSEEIARQEASLVDTFRKNGMQVADVDVESFRKPVLASVPGKFESRWGRGTWDKVAGA